MMGAMHRLCMFDDQEGRAQMRVQGIYQGVVRNGTGEEQWRKGADVATKSISTMPTQFVQEQNTKQARVS